MATIYPRAPDASLVTVRGIVWRGLRIGNAAKVLDGSVQPARFSAPGQPALYLSATQTGVWTALHVAKHHERAAFKLFPIEIDAGAILDLRDVQACAGAGIDPADAGRDWRSAVAAGVVPPSWEVRRRAEAIGAVCLIDPSRHAPRLWHLVLFRWNEPGAPQVRLRTDLRAFRRDRPSPFRD